MGFFKKAMSFGIGAISETAGDIFDDLAGVDDELDEEELDEDEELDRNKKKKNNKPNILSTPAPPPVPMPQQSLSVMIAVNGQSYGPYEKVTLIELINNGSLTRDTYVFIEGMDKWMPASQVAAVNALFSQPSTAPVAPPVPWTTPSASQAPQTVENNFSPRLNSLINAAVADGEITDMERQVLIRNAQQEGVQMDEFVMVLEARLFEQRQALQTRQQNVQQPVAMPTPAATPSSTVKEKTYAAVRKCPSCGNVLNRSDIVKCPDCGYELEKSNLQNPIQPLIDKLDELDRELGSGLLSSMNPFKQRNIQDRKSTAIASFIVPNTRSAIMDFFMIANSAVKALSFGDPVKKAWKAKVKELVERSKSLYPEDVEFQNTLRSIAKEFGVKIK